jgi:hypothetical protein
MDAQAKEIKNKVMCEINSFAIFCFVSLCFFVTPFIMQAMLRNKLMWPTLLKYDIVFLNESPLDFAINELYCTMKVLFFVG